MQRGEVFRREGRPGWSIRFYDASGKRRQRSGFRTKAEANAKLDSMLSAVRTGEFVEVNLSLRELVDAYLAQHDAQPSTIGKLRALLVKATDEFGDRPIRRLRPEELGAWRLTLSDGTRWDATRALKQVLAAAVRWKYLSENPLAYVKNPRPRSKEFIPFGSWDEIMELADAMPTDFRLAPILGAGTGMRPAEWLALEWDDIDFERLVVHVRRATTDGVVTDLKTTGSARSIPLRQLLISELETAFAARTSQLVFPSATGTYMDLRNFRHRAWLPAFDVVDQLRRRPYDLRHTYATWSLRAGVNTFTLSRRMGTSIEMIDRTYGHLTADATVHEIGLLDAFDAAAPTQRPLAKPKDNVVADRTPITFARARPHLTVVK